LVWFTSGIQKIFCGMCSLMIDTIICELRLINILDNGINSIFLLYFVAVGYLLQNFVYISGYWSVIIKFFSFVVKFSIFYFVIFYISGPVLLVMIINAILMVITIKVGFWGTDDLNLRNAQKLIAKRKRVLSFICLFCILGFTWISFLLYIHEIYTLFSYLFIILNGTQV